MTARHPRPKRGDPVQPGDSERDIAIKIGMSRRRQWQAKKITEIPEQEFERLVEGPPPTVTGLLDMAHHRATPKKHCPHCGGDL